MSVTTAQLLQIADVVLDAIVAGSGLQEVTIPPTHTHYYDIEPHRLLLADNRWIEVEALRVGDLAYDTNLLAKVLSGQLEPHVMLLWNYANVLRAVAHQTSTLGDRGKTLARYPGNNARELVKTLLPGLGVDGYIGIALALSQSCPPDRFTDDFDSIIDTLCEMIDDRQVLERFALRLVDLIGESPAIRTLNHRADLDPFSRARAHKLYALGHIYFRKGDADSARRYWEKYREECPDEGQSE